MTIANVFQGNTRSLPPSLQAAQDAIHLPEVQQMLRRLSRYRLGIFMPHMHDEKTGEFQPLPDHVMQVESGLEVSFQDSGNVVSQPERFLPVGWLWHEGEAIPVAACEMVQSETPCDALSYVKHKMPN
jgi:hypothetical protein